MRFESDINMYLPRHWKIVKIEEIGEVVGGGTPSTRNPKYFGGEIAWITPKDLSGYDSKYISRGERNITELGLKNSSAKLMPKNTVLLSSRAPIGYVAIAANDISTNQGFKSVICDEEKINPEFLYYIFKISKRRLESVASGTTFKEVSGKKVKEFKIPLPPLNEQLSIISILNRLDKKIELNNSIISNLEELAQTLFKRWFVDFEFPNEEGEPYKSSGGQMVASELGMIPEGWNVGNLNYFIHQTMNGDWGKAEAEKNHQFPVNIIRGADIPELRFGRSGQPPKRFILERNFKNKALHNGDVIVEISGGSPTQSTGRTLFVDQNILGKFDNKVVSTNFCRVLRPNFEEHGTFIHLYFTYLYNKHVFFNYENGTTGIKNLDIKSVLEELKVVLPDEAILNKFNSFAYVLLNGIQKLGEENNKLEAIRDTLLPKLLSGEIELPDDVEVTDDVPIS